MIKVKVENLKKNFGSLEVLKDINMEVKEGEVVCLIGQLPAPGKVHSCAV